MKGEVEGEDEDGVCGGDESEREMKKSAASQAGQATGRLMDGNWKWKMALALRR